MSGFDALKRGQNALSLIWCQIFQSQVIWSNMFFLQMLYWHVSKSQLKYIMLHTVLAEFCVAKFLSWNCMLLNLTLETSLFLILPTSLPALFMSRLKLERYYEGFVRRGDVGTAIICRSCWDNAERGHRGEIQGEGRYGNEGRNPSLFNGMLPHSFAIILTILIMCLPSGTRRPVSLSPVLEPVAHLAARMKYWAKGLDRCTQKTDLQKY